MFTTEGRKKLEGRLESLKGVSLTLTEKKMEIDEEEEDIPIGKRFSL